jgi:hypothetical protein
VSSRVRIEIAPQKELKSKFKLQIITIFALSKNYHEHKKYSSNQAYRCGNFFY